MRVLFVCTGNTCRSPLAERLARQLYPRERFESAGVLPAGGMQPATATVLDELGAETADFVSRSVYELDLAAFTDIVLIGETAAAQAPPLPAGVRAHYWDVADPFEFSGSESEQREVYRRCAVELKLRIEQLVRFVSVPETKR